MRLRLLRQEKAANPAHRLPLLPGHKLTADISPYTGQYFEEDGQCASKAPPFSFRSKLVLLQRSGRVNMQPSQALGIILHIRSIMMPIKGQRRAAEPHSQH
jgi:hypothetical protein